MSEGLSSIPYGVGVVNSEGTGTDKSSQRTSTQPSTIVPLASQLMKTQLPLAASTTTCSPTGIATFKRVVPFGSACSQTFPIRTAVISGVAVGSGVSVSVDTKVAVAVEVGVLVAVLVAVGVLIGVDVSVAVNVGVFVKVAVGVVWGKATGSNAMVNIK